MEEDMRPHGVLHGLLTWADAQGEAEQMLAKFFRDWWHNGPAKLPGGIHIAILSALMVVRHQAESCPSSGPSSEHTCVKPNGN